MPLASPQLRLALASQARALDARLRGHDEGKDDKGDDDGQTTQFFSEIDVTN